MHFLPKISSKIEHPVPWLFLGVQGGLTSQKKNVLNFSFQWCRAKNSM